MILPKHYRRYVVYEPGPEFRKVAKLVEAELPQPGPGEVLIRNLVAGVNASDPMWASGAYDFLQPPIEMGCEAGGEIVAVGADVSELKVGQHVVVFAPGGYGEYVKVAAAQAIPVREVTPAAISSFIVGVTASVGLNETGVLRSGETVLVTAAAGGVGSYAVQLARIAGNRVVGTCSDDGKAAWLRQLGCERVVNYHKEDLDAVLAAEYPQGINVVFESVGRAMFDTAVKHLAVFGRLVSIGAVSEYVNGMNWEKVEAVRPYYPLMGKCATFCGCLLTMYPQEVWRRHYDALQASIAAGTLQPTVDERVFQGLSSVPDAVDYLQSGRNRGKVVIRLG